MTCAWNHWHWHASVSKAPSSYTYREHAGILHTIVIQRLPSQLIFSRTVREWNILPQVPNPATGKHFWMLQERRTLHVTPVLALQCIAPLPWGARGCQPSFTQHTCTTCSTFSTCTCSMNQPSFLQDHMSLPPVLESLSRWSWCSICQEEEEEEYKNQYITSGARCIPRPIATGRVSCVCDWLSDATGLDSGDRSWICNAARSSSAMAERPRELDRRF